MSRPLTAADIMTREVVTVSPDDEITAVARTLSSHGISGAPVVDPSGRLVGMVSEADLIRRRDEADEEQSSWWLEMLADGFKLAPEFVDYVRANRSKVVNVMSRDLVAVGPDASIREIVALIERHHVKRLPVVENGKVVGIVSRANLITALADAGGIEKLIG